MGKSYWFECAKCGYRASVSGRADRGIHLFVQTIHCQDCRALYDAVTRMRVADEAGFARANGGFQLSAAGGLRRQREQVAPPPFFSALNRLQILGRRSLRWVSFQLQCPASPHHRFRVWNDPDQCPRCGLLLEKNSLPFRVWD
jgi:hypothetical protein